MYDWVVPLLYLYFERVRTTGVSIARHHWVVIHLGGPGCWKTDPIAFADYREKGGVFSWTI